MTLDEKIAKLLEIKRPFECADLEIGKTHKNEFTVGFIDGWVIEEDSFAGVFGCGKTVEEAVDDYIERINHKHMKFEPDDDVNENSYEVEVNI